MSTLLLLAIFSQGLVAKEDRRAQKPTNSSPSGLILDYKPVFNVNEVEAWIANDARLFQTSRDNAGFFWPAGSGKSAIFAMAPWLACRFEGQEGFGGLRTAAVQNIGRNGTEFRPGRIIRTAAGIQADDQTKPEYRLYVIRSGDNENTNPDYRDWPYEQGAPYKTLLNYNRSADSFAVAPDQVIPGVTPPIAVDKRTGDPILPESGETLSQYVTRVKDRLEPKLIGAVSAWCVYNDMVPGTRRFSAQPMRCEIQQYAFAFATSGPIGRAVFFKFRVINRNVPNPANPSSGLWKDTYFAIWNDNDLGDAGDDLVGVDTLRSLAYCYNANNNDPVYGAAPPAVGVDYFQGPFKRKNVPFTGTPRPVELDTATTIPLPGGGTIPNPRLNQPATLGASAHVRFDNAGGPIGDPETNRPDHVYNFMRGLDKNGNPLGNTQPGSNFMFPGDPETGQGIIETQPADKRQLIVTGPFDVYAGEEQLIVVGVHIAKGTNNLNSVTRLRNENNAIQDLFNANFQAPQPPAPKVQASALENEVILNWVDDNPRSQSYTKALENVPLTRPGADTVANPNDKYFFEGYNVYQFELIEGRSIPTARVVKIATFDKINNITSVLDFDPRRTDALGRPIVDITQTGTNSGIQRSLRITEDAIKGGPLIRGRRYFFAVTSYFVNPYLLTKNPYPNPVTGIIEREGSAALESLERIFEVVPQPLAPGTVLPARTGDRLNTDRFSRFGDDNVKVQVEDPTQLRNRRIKIKIANAQGTRWELRDANNDSLLYPRANDPVDSLNVLRITREDQYNPDSLADFERRADAAIFGGLRVIVKQNLPGVKRDGQLGTPPVVYSPANNRWFLPKAASYDTLRAGPSAGSLTSVATNFNRNGISDGGTICYPRIDIFGGQEGQGTLLPTDSLLPVAIVFLDTSAARRDTMQWTRAYRYVLNIQRGGVGANSFLIAADTSYLRFIDTTTNALFPGGVPVPKINRLNANGPYQDRRRIPVQAFKMRPRPNGGFDYERVNLLFTERNERKDLGFNVNGKWEPSTATHGGQELLYVMNSPYQENEDRLQYIVGATNNQPRYLVTQSNQLDIAYALWIRQQAGRGYRGGDTLFVYPNYRLTPQTEYVIETQAPRFEQRAAEDRLARISVYPNPYLGSSGRERFLRQTFVTFTNLPRKCKIRIFTLNGDLVRVIERDNPNSSIEDWNLRNSANIPVASGMYLVHIETEFGNKILKLGVIMRQEREDFF
ncbi:MAG: T9SS type A sorting domain-containing protein [Chloroherpetonaceae bacterium]|nr:T9SS type A sorting domain-containing protein [Chloroherpetonaceae bacterium]MDW8438063.1 T9SS type A sorting domain-containing protein [Chloroherpetonaceae bacterium]